MAFYDIYLVPRSLGGSEVLGIRLSQEDRLTEGLLLFCLGWGLVGSQLFYFVYCAKGSLNLCVLGMKAWKWEGKLGFVFLYTATFTSQQYWQKQTEKRNSLRAMVMLNSLSWKVSTEGSVQYGAKSLIIKFTCCLSLAVTGHCWSHVISWTYWSSESQDSKV